MAATIGFKTGESPFAKTLRRKVNEYFDGGKIKRTGNWTLYVKTGILLSLAVLIYTAIMAVSMPGWVALLLCAAEGVVFASIGFNVMHDGAHGSYSSRRWVNRIMAHTLDVMGGSTHIWKQKHNMIHHSFTNIEGLDDDIDIRPWLRTNESQHRYGIHRYQHIYWGFLYGLTYVSWVFFNDFRKYFSRRIAGTPLKRMKFVNHLVFWASKLAYLAVFIIIPALEWGWAGTALGYLVFSFVCGLLIGVVFQLAHVVKDASFPVPDSETQRIEQHWAEHQLESTANFSPRSRFMFWLTGGLNYQIEHHLFPRISHVHYPAISRIVKDVCRQFNVGYIEYPTLRSALHAHVMHLKALG